MVVKLFPETFVTVLLCHRQPHGFGSPMAIVKLVYRFSYLLHFAWTVKRNLVSQVTSLVYAWTTLNIKRGLKEDTRTRKKSIILMVTLRTETPDHTQLVRSNHRHAIITTYLPNCRSFFFRVPASGPATISRYDFVTLDTSFEVKYLFSQRVNIDSVKCVEHLFMPGQ